MFSKKDSGKNGNQGKQSDLRQLTGLWPRKSANGEEYYGGDFTLDEGLPAGSYKLLVFENHRRPTNESPEYRVLICPDDRAASAAAPTRHAVRATQDDDEAATQMSDEEWEMWQAAHGSSDLD